MKEATATPVRSAVAESLTASPIIGVVRTESRQEGARQARAMIDGGLEAIEITFTVPEAVDLVRELIRERPGEGPPWFGMGTVTDRARAEAAVAAGAAFLVSPNTDPEVAEIARSSELFLVLGALTCSEIVEARRLGADMVKVYPLPPVGGASYLATIRQPLADIPMLAAGGFDVEAIPEYRAAGAIAYGMGAPLLLKDPTNSETRIARALALARGDSS